MKAWSLRVATPLLLVLFSVLQSLTAQSSAPSENSLATAIPAIQRQDAGGAFWRIDGNFDSVLRLRNVLENRSVTVTPVLWMADGTEYSLAPVTIDKSGVAAIDINEALRDAPVNVAPHVSDVGSAGVRYEWRWAAVMGQVTSTDEVHSLSYASSISTPLESARSAQDNTTQQNRLEGMWWQRDAGVEPFLRLVNTGSKQLAISVALTGEDDNAPITSDIVIGARQSQLLKLGDLVNRLPVKATAGGIYVSYQGSTGALAVEGGLQNFDEGYSAPMPLVPLEAKSLRRMISTSSTTLAAIGVQVGSPEPRMQFPKDTYFTPYATLRNPIPKPARVAIAAVYMNPNAITTQLGDITLPARSTRQVDLKAMLSRAGLAQYSGEMNFTFRIDGGGDEILVSAGSTSADGNYVFSVDPMLLVPETGKIFCLWAASGKTDTMISFWNSGSSAQDAELLLSYQGGEYRLPIHLAANASSSINVGSLIRSGTPDAHGNVIPSSVIQGSAQLLNPHHGRDPMDIHAHASVFNVETATCWEPCPGCDSIIYVIAVPNGVTTPSGTVQYHTTATSKTNGSFDVTYRTTWGSSNTGVATIIASGTQGGLATGQYAGSTTMTGQYRDTGVPSWKPGALCQYGTQCPLFFGSPTAPINVKLPKYISVNTDGTVVYACPNGSSRRRSVNYNVIATDGSQVSTPFSLLETVDPATQSSCTNGTVLTSSLCTLIPTGNYTDALDPGCPATPALAKDCGYTYPLQKWEWCNPLRTSYPSLGSIGTDTVHNILINLGGNTTQFLPGTTFPHD